MMKRLANLLLQLGFAWIRKEAPIPTSLPHVVIDQVVAAGARTLRIGAEGADVRLLQQTIGTVVDGVFGPATAGALTTWQQAHGLLADGIAGVVTWNALGVESTAPPVFVPPVATSPLVERVARALRAMPNTFEPDIWAAVLAGDMEEAGITTTDRIAIFLSNIYVETGGLRTLVENMSYSGPRMMQVWPSRFPTIESTNGFVHNPRALAEKVYGGRLGNTRPGDAWAARGRGGYQTTGMDNYRALAAATGQDVAVLTSENSPLTTRAGASRSATIFWKSAGMNEMADKGQSRLIRIRGNGGTLGLDHLLSLEAKARSAL
jgi:predicted chitinase